MTAGIASKPPGEATRGRRLDPRRGTFWALSIPSWLVVSLLLVGPLALMVVFSFRPDMRGALLAPFEPSLRQFEQIAESGAYLRLLGTSALMAVAVATIATLAAYPIAYFLAFRAGRRAALYLVLLLVPFWTSYVLRVAAWKVMLGSDGAINTALLGLGIIGEPLEALLYNRTAVVVTLIYVWIPFASLPILAALGRIDIRLHEAAADLYASPFEQFRRVTLPLSLPGIAAAFLMVFIPTVGEYVTPLLVGGTGGSMYGNTIYSFFSRAANWPLGSALSTVMLVVTVGLVLIGLRIVRPSRLLGT
jgi:spermidine/putrescine transport system permease protein